MDAILAYDAEGKPIEPEWPEADVIVGNPPFLGDKRMRRELQDKYVDDLCSLYARRSAVALDLVRDRLRKQGQESQVGIFAR